MFGFFRRSKKNVESKKPKNDKSSDCKFINDIQCFAVDKFEINLCTTSPSKKEQSKPIKVQRSRSSGSAMGNSESTTKKAGSTCANEYSAADMNYQQYQQVPNLNNNNVYQKPNPKTDAAGAVRSGSVSREQKTVELVCNKSKTETKVDTAARSNSVPVEQDPAPVCNSKGRTETKVDSAVRSGSVSREPKPEPMCTSKSKTETKMDTVRSSGVSDEQRNAEPICNGTSKTETNVETVRSNSVSNEQKPKPMCNSKSRTEMKVDTARSRSVSNDRKPELICDGNGTTDTKVETARFRSVSNEKKPEPMRGNKSITDIEMGIIRSKRASAEQKPSGPVCSKNEADVKSQNEYETRFSGETNFGSVRRNAGQKPEPAEECDARSRVETSAGKIELASPNEPKFRSNQEKCGDENRGDLQIALNMAKTADEGEAGTNTTQKMRDINLSLECNGVMTNGDKYSRQTQMNSAETTQDDTDGPEDFGTAPSSPTDEEVINQRGRNSMERERSHSSELDAKERLSRRVSMSEIAKSDTPVRVENDRGGANPEKPDAEQPLPIVADTNISGSSERNKEASDSDRVRGHLPGDSSIRSTCQNYETATSLYDNGTAKKTENDAYEKTGPRNVRPFKTEIEKAPAFLIGLPEHFLQYQSSRCRTNRIKIPDITITESSDSEGENDDSENEYENEYYRDNCYERTFPSILYDITEVDEFSDASDVDFSSLTDDDKRNIVHQESKFQEQIKTLKCELETKDMENMQLRGKINDLQRDITNKTWGMDRLHAELASFQTEADCVRKKLLKVEEDLSKYRTKNVELNEQLLQTFENETDSKKVSTLQNEIEKLKGKIKELQIDLEVLKKEKSDLQVKLLESETEKREKLKTMEMALDESLKQKQKLQTRFEEEYEKLRTVNSDREQQLLNDFEWKLREVELTCKRRLEEKDRKNEEKLKQIKDNLEKEIARLKEQLKEVDKMKSYEAEVNQLRGLTQEQERSLRMTTKASEQLQNNERTLKEEIEKLRSSLDKERTHLATVQGIHSREISEKDRKHSFKLEQQKNELNAQMEDKVRRELIRLKLELERTYKDEKRHLLDETKTKVEEQLRENNQTWEKKIFESKRELEILEKKLSEKEDSYRKELLRQQTNSDRDMLELRRKLDKMDLSYQEQLEKKQEQHEREIEYLREEYEKKIQQCEQNWSQQISSTRATLELVKEQLQREADAQMEALSKKYMLELELQYEKLAHEKEEVIGELQEKYNSKMYEIQNNLNEELTSQKLKENELLQIIEQLKEEIKDKSNNETTLYENLDCLQNTILALQEKISNYESLSTEAEASLKKREADHAGTIAEMKECYENEIKYWKSKIVLPSQTEASPMEEKSAEPVVMVEECQNINVSGQSKSSRRKGRGRHKNQKNYQRQLSKQFSSSSL